MSHRVPVPPLGLLNHNPRKGTQESDLEKRPNDSDVWPGLGVTDKGDQL